jgi:tetratricopeptide (TPR) repeat protein
MLVLVALLHGAARAATRPSDGSDKWIRVDTAHLTLFSDASLDTTIEFGRRLESFRAILARLGPGLSPDSPLPTWVFIFKDDVAFTPYKHLLQGRDAAVPANVDGFFVQHDDGNYIGVDAAPSSTPWPVIYHEYFHFFLHNNFDDIPLWFNEGMAQCYSTFRIESKSIVIGGPITPMADWLRLQPLIPLTRLLAVTFDSPEYNDPGRSEIFYAQSWAMAHYLLWGGAASAEAGAGFLHGLKRGGGLDKALAPLTTAVDPDLERHVAEYVRKSRYTLSVLKRADLQFDDTSRSAPMERIEVLYRLGDFLVHIDPMRARDAAEHLREAIRIDPNHAPAHAGLGRALEAQRRYPEAHDEFEKAINLDPADPSLSLAYADALLRETLPAGPSMLRPDQNLPPGIARARELFEAVTRASPDDPRAWAGLGTTYLYDAVDSSPGIPALKRAFLLMPFRTDVAHNLAALYAENGQRDRAQELVERVLERSADPEMRAAGKTILFQADLAEVDALIRKGERNAATTRLRALLASAPSPASRSIAEQRLRSLEEVAAQSDARDRFKEAITKANAKEYDAAAEILERLLAATDDPQVVREAVDLLAQVRDVQSLGRAVELAGKGDYPKALSLLDGLIVGTKDPRVADKARELRARLQNAMAGPTAPPK